MARGARARPRSWARRHRRARSRASALPAPRRACQARHTHAQRVSTATKHIHTLFFSCLLQNSTICVRHHLIFSLHFLQIVQIKCYENIILNLTEKLCGLKILALLLTVHKKTTLKWIMKAKVIMFYRIIYCCHNYPIAKSLHCERETSYIILMKALSRLNV